MRCSGQSAAAEMSCKVHALGRNSFGRVKFTKRGDVTREKDFEMNRLIKLGLAAAFMVGGASYAIAQDAAPAEPAPMAPAAPGAEAGAAAPAETGSIGAPATTYGELITKMQSATAPDLTAFADTSTINCVKVSTLQEDGSNNAAALDTAVTDNQEALSSMQSAIQGNQAFLDKVMSSCAVAEVDPTKILSVEAGSDGSYTVYLDDRAA